MWPMATKSSGLEMIKQTVLEEVQMKGPVFHVVVFSGNGGCCDDENDDR